MSYILPSWLPSHYCIPYSFRKQHQDYLSMWFSFQSGAIAPSMDEGNYLLTSFQHAEASGLTTAAYTSSICIIKTGMPHPTCCWQCTLPQSALWKQECFTQLVVGSVHFLNLHYENRNASPNLLLTAYSFSSLPHSKRKFSGRQVIWLWFRFRYRRSGSCKGLSGKAWIWLLSHKQYQMWLLSHKQYQTSVSYTHLTLPTSSTV